MPQLSKAAPQVPRRHYRGHALSAHHLQGYTVLGVLKLTGHRNFEYYEWRFLKWAHQTLTQDWHLVQGGSGGRSRYKWLEIMQTLELDRKAQVDLFLLAHQGPAGRSEANEILWDMLPNMALTPEYKDLSSKTSAMVGTARRYLDMPPWRHGDRPYWTWSNYWVPHNKAFDPARVPRGNFTVATRPGGRPISPPH